MKLKICSLFICMCMLMLTVFGSVAEAQSITRESGNSISVTDYGASGSDTKDDYSAIQSALNVVRDSGSQTIVNVPAGTYYISGILKIYSNTYLKMASGAKLLRSDDGKNIMQNGIDSGMSSAAGYTYSHDITIEGGTFDGNTKNTKNARAVIKMQKIKNITFLNTTVTNICGTHFVILDGCSDITVKNCTFSNFKEFTGTAASYKEQTAAEYTYRGTEALHTDFIEKNSVDTKGLPCKNLSVTGCTFSKCTTGIGTHHVYDYMTADKMVVSNNTFKDCYFYCMDATSMSNYSFANNVATNTGGLVYLERVSGTVTGNKLTSRMTLSGSMYSHDNFNGEAPFLNAIRISDKSNVTLNSNTITGTTGNGIYVLDNSKFSINTYSVTNALMNGVMVYNGTSGTAENVTVTTASLNGISVRKNSSATLVGCNFTSAKENGAFITDSTLNTSFCSFKKCSNNGLSFSSNGKGTCVDTESGNNANQGFYISGGSVVTAESNYVHDNGKNAFMVAGGSKATLNYNNIMKNKDYDLLVTGNSKGNTFKNNGTDKNKTKVESGSSATISGSKSCLKAYAFTIPTSANYTGSQIKPTVTTKLKNNTDFTISYGANKNAGYGTVKITGKGSYAGSFTLRFTIKAAAATPKPVETIPIFAVSSNNSITVKWTPDSQYTGYELQYADNKAMTSATSVAQAQSASKYTMNSLATDKVMYFRIRGTKTGSTGAWSSVIKVVVRDNTPFLSGDANEDTKINVTDMLVIKKSVVGISVKINKLNADCNFDGDCTVSDMLLIKKHVVGIKISPWD